MRVVVVHYEPAEAAALAARLRRDGLDAEPYPHLGPKGFRELRLTPPDAILIDLMRMPSYGKAIGALLREQKGTRAIPLVFLAGDPEKTARVRELLPDAGFTTLAGTAAALRRAAARSPAAPVVPENTANAAEKLRIRKDAAVGLIGAPPDVEDVLGPLPAGVRLRRGGHNADVLLLFVRSAAELGRELQRLTGGPAVGALWVLWPKRSSGARATIALPRIHEICEPLGLVAYKTCAVDKTWSAAAISPRKRAR